MSNDDWTFQLSLKLGADKSALLNIRGKDLADFVEALHGLASNAPEIAVAAATFEPPKTAAPPAAIAAFRAASPPANSAADDSRPASIPPQRSPAPPPLKSLQIGTEIGPCVLRAEEKAFIAKSGFKAGQAASRYVASLPGGITASTFDGLVGSILLQLNGQNAYVRVEKNDKGYYEVISARPA
jgi:hypothetical protein